jgi:hypothetical protein
MPQSCHINSTLLMGWAIEVEIHMALANVLQRKAPANVYKRFYDKRPKKNKTNDIRKHS